jgi:hypothetical protein
MKGRRFLLLAGPLALATLLVGSIALAQQDAEPASPQSPEAALGTGFTYQGYLTDGSGPVNDTCDFTFGLYDEAGSGTPPTGGTLLGTVSEPGKQVSDGYFSVELDFGADDFTGDARYLQITVDCGSGATTLSPRQPLTAVPYALSLRPGAAISGTGTVLTIAGANDSGAALDVTNSEAGAGDSAIRGVAGAGSGYPGSTKAGVWGDSDGSCGVVGASNTGTAVYGTSGSGFGVYGSGSYGVYAHGSTGDLRLSTTGTIYANDAPGSDLELHSNDNVDVHLDDDDNSTSQFRVLDDTNTAVFTVNEAGAIQSTAEITIAVSPLKMVAEADSASNVTLRPVGPYMEVRPGSAAYHTVFVPVDLPSVLFGTPTKLKRVQVCYKCDNSASYITFMAVRYANDSGGYTQLIQSTTDLDDTSWDCYTISAYTPSEIQGSVYVRLGLDFDATGDTHDIQIGKITLTLTEQ